MTRARRVATAAGVAACLAFASAFAAPAKKEKASPPPSPPPSAGAAAPYDPDLLRLSEIVGSLAYLTDLCGKGDGAVWRAEMAKLLQAVAESETRRERMAGAFNKGFRDFELTYKTCTANARSVISRYVDEGAGLTRDIASRYGGG